jgi:23S rRNA pseudouridine1911/1915/1917 synthase
MPNAEHKRITVSVPSGIDPVRVDKYLASCGELDLSRAFIQQMMADKLVAIDGETVAKNHKLKGGETIRLHIPPPEIPDLTPEDMPLDIEYEDDHLAVINKPAGLVVHPAPGNPSHTLVNALLHHFGRLSSDDSPGGMRPGIIHRLDKDTSGLLLVAKSDSVARRLRQQLAGREIIKIYTAVVCGHMPDSKGTIHLPIGRSIRDRKKMTVTNVKSREAITHYTVKERYRSNDLVEVRLETGRTHQIRVHLSHLNRPVLGDPDYGGRHKWLRGIMPEDRRTGKELLDIIDRQALHATSLGFVHPVTKKRMTVTSGLPQDIERLLDYLRSQKT